MIGRKGKRGEVPFVPTPEQRGVVAVMAATHIPAPHIATLIINPESGKHISKTTLFKHFPNELAEGHMKVRAFVINKLFRLIQNDEPSAIYFYLKTQCGWRERMEVSGPDGGPVKVEHSAALVNFGNLSLEEQRTYIAMTKKLHDGAKQPQIQA